jgi:hypothetical protein
MLELQECGQTSAKSKNPPDSIQQVAGISVVNFDYLWKTLGGRRAGAK